MPGDSPALMVRIEDPNPPEVRVTLLGLKLADGPDEVIITPSVITPAKPFTLAKLTVVC